MESGINFPVYLLSGLGVNLNVLFWFVPDLLLTKPTVPNCCSRRWPKGAVAGNGANSSWWWDQVFPDPGGHAFLTTISSVGKFSEFRKQRVGNVIWEHIFPTLCVSIWRHVHHSNTLVLLHPAPTSVRDLVKKLSTAPCSSLSLAFAGQQEYLLCSAPAVSPEQPLQGAAGHAWVGEGCNSQPSVDKPLKLRGDISKPTCIKDLKPSLQGID